MNNLFSKLIEYSKSDYYPFHMPGHKRILEAPYSYDITEIENFDNLHKPEGIIKNIMDRASQFYKTKSTYLLVNGSTCGVLSAISSVARMGDSIIIGRNCHKSVYDAIFVLGLKPIYIYPELIEEMGINGRINPEDVERETKKNPDVKAVVMTSPTYEGIVSDIKGISDFLRNRSIPLIVDEAHGAHLGLHPEFLPSAISQGADIVIQSVHKTLPSLTQTALLHLNSSLIDKKVLENFIEIYQTSSPSYVLLASMERCIDLLIENGPLLFNDYIEMLKGFLKKCDVLKNIKIFDTPFKDISKLVISVKDTDITGEELYFKFLEEYHLQFEMKEDDYVLGITSFCDSEEGFERLYKALFEIDKKIKRENKKSYNVDYSVPETYRFSPYEAFYKEKENISIEDSIGRIAGEYKYLYPPGIPIVVPGELISEEIIYQVKRTDNKIIVIKGDA